MFKTISECSALTMDRAISRWNAGLWVPFPTTYKTISLNISSAHIAFRILSKFFYKRGKIFNVVSFTELAVELILEECMLQNAPEEIGLNVKNFSYVIVALFFSDYGKAFQLAPVTRFGKPYKLPPYIIVRNVSVLN